VLNNPAHAGPRSWWPAPTSAPARPGSTPSGRCGTGVQGDHRARFGDIFRGNSLKEGLLPVQLDLKAVEALWAMAESEPDKPITIDLPAREVRVDDAVWTFPIDDFSRWRLMEGLDDIGLTCAMRTRSPRTSRSGDLQAGHRPAVIAVRSAFSPPSVTPAGANSLRHKGFFRANVCVCWSEGIRCAQNGSHWADDALPRHASRSGGKP
jgi:hypothetical protein